MANINNDDPNWIQQQVAGLDVDVVDPQQLQQPGRYCQICFEHLSESEFSGGFCEFGHDVCNQCFTSYITHAVEARQAEIRCPLHHVCRQHLEDEDIERVVGRNTFLQYQQHIRENQHYTIPTDENGEAQYYAPFSTADIENNEWMIRCVDPFCDGMSCIKDPTIARSYVCVLCHRDWPITRGDRHFCKRIFEDPMLSPEERRLKFYVRFNTRQCPNCNVTIEKNGGCPRMSCTCGANFCWRCGGVYKSNILLGNHYTRFGLLGCPKILFPYNKAARLTTRSTLLVCGTVGAVVLLPVALVGAAIVLPIRYGVKKYRDR